jgi:hypothetical protein
MKKIRFTSLLMPWFICAGMYSPLVAATITDADWIPTSGGPYGVQAMAMDSSGNIYVGGQFHSIGGNVIGYRKDSIPGLGNVNVPILDSVIVLNNIAKWDGMRWSSLDTGLTMGNLPASFTPSVNALAVHGTDLYVGGYFFKAGNVDVGHIAKWDGTHWSAVGPGFTDQVQALAFVGSDLYAGGKFAKIYGGDSVKGIAKWNGTAWSSLSVKLANAFTGYPVVSAIASSGSDIYAGGYFTFGNTGNPVSVGKWNGSSWSALGSGIAGNGVTVSSITVDGSDVYVGGQYMTAGGVASEKIAKWNGSSWSGFGTGIQGGQGNVYAIAVQGTNVFATGSWLTTAGGVPVNNIAQWDGSTWKTMGQGLSGYAYAFVFNKARTVLYVGGSFGTAGGKSSPGLAGVQIAPMGAPTMPPQLISYVPDTTNVKITWRKGNGKARVVAISQVNTGTPTPKDSTTYAPSTEFGKGDTVGLGSWYCVYNGDTATTVTVSGLAPGTTYYLAAFEYNNGPGSERFLKISSGKNLFVTLPGTVSPVAMDTVRADSAEWKWHGVASAMRYEFQMANDTSFTVNLMRDTSVADSVKLIKGLADGTYYWRVHASNLSGWGAWSSRQQTVVKIPETGLRSQRFAIKSFSFSTVAGSIRYQLPSACKVTLKLFDLHGRLAATLVDADQVSGRYTVTGFNRKLATSCYAVVFEAGLYNTRRLLTIVR